MIPIILFEPMYLSVNCMLKYCTKIQYFPAQYLNTGSMSNGKFAAVVTLLKRRIVPRCVSCIDFILCNLYDKDCANVSQWILLITILNIMHGSNVLASPLPPSARGLIEFDFWSQALSVPLCVSVRTIQTALADWQNIIYRSSPPPQNFVTKRRKQALRWLHEPPIMVLFVLLAISSW